MGLLPVAGKGTHDLVVVIHNDVEQVGGLGKGRTFHQIAVEGVAVRHVAVAGLGVGTAAQTGVKGVVVVGVDGLPPGNAWDDGLAPAAEARQEVVDHAAGKDDLIASHGIAVQPDRGAPAGGTHVGQVFLVIAIMVDEPDTAVEVLPHQRDMLLLGLGPMGAGGAEDEDVLVGDAGPVEPFHQNGQIGAGLLPPAGGVRDEDADRLPRMDGLLDGTGPDGMVQGILDMLPHRPLGQIHRVGVDFCHHLRGVQCHCKFGFAVLHTFHIHSPSFLGERAPNVSIYDGSTLPCRNQETPPAAKRGAPADADAPFLSGRCGPNHSTRSRS